MKKTNGQNGITLIALVVTIVVLLILAGITITFVLSDGGIFSTAKKAASQTEIATVSEYTNNALASIYASYYDSTVPAASKNYSAMLKANFPSTTTWETEPSVTCQETDVTTGEGEAATTVKRLEINMAQVKATVNGKDYNITIANSVVTVTPVTEPAA